MIIQYQPDGGDLQRLDAGRLRASEIQIAERTAGGRWPDIKEGVRQGDIGALRVVAWVILRRTQPALRFSEFDPWEGELRARLDRDEVASYAAGIVEKYAAEPDDMAEAFDELRDAADDLEACERAIVDVTTPKGQAAAEPQETETPGQETEPETAASPPGA